MFVVAELVFFNFEHRALFSFTLNCHSRHKQTLWGHVKLKTLQEIYEHKQSFPKFNLHITNKIYRPAMIMITFYLTIKRDETSPLVIYLL